MAELALSFLCHRVDAKKGSASAQNTTPLSLVKSFTTPGTSSEEHPYNSTNTQSLKMELIQLNNYVLLQSLSWRGGPMLYIIELVIPGFWATFERSGDRDGGPAGG